MSNEFKDWINDFSEEQKKNYAYKAEDYIERSDAIKKEKFEKGTKK